MTIEQQIQEYRAEAAQRRAEAFCDAPEYVLGTRVLPMTPRTYSMLCAIRSPFLVGGDKREGDVRNYLWFHSRLYGNCDAWLWRARKWWALDGLTTALTRPVHRWLGLPHGVDHYCAALVLAIGEIETIVYESLADLTCGDDRARAAGATLEAQLCHVFQKEYGWPPEKTRNMPLKRLAQYWRSMNPDAEDAGERRLIREHLERRNAELAAEAKKEAGNGG